MIPTCYLRQVPHGGFNGFRLQQWWSEYGLAPDADNHYTGVRQRECLGYDGSSSMFGVIESWTKKEVGEWRDVEIFTD